MTFKHLQLTSYVMAAFIDGKVRMIDWQPGGNPPFFANATLTTDDEALIAHIKARPEYGTVIVEVEVPKEEAPEGGEDFTLYEEVTTVQQAKDILVKNHEAQISKLTNKTTVLEYATSVNVKFPNLPVE